ncbi:MAG: hypothetical protein JW829_13920 [Pirellulales bacterium]|nr:hypothetical protein [Pirellulales bacterium]
MKIHAIPWRAAFSLIALFGVFAISGTSVMTSLAEEPLDIQVPRLILQLGEEDVTRRDAAEKQLLELAGLEDGRNRQRVLELMPQVNSQMPADVRHRLARIRETLARSLAEAFVTSSHVILDAKNMPLSEVLASIEKQTGNRILGLESIGGDVREMPLTISIKDQSFWKAIDNILDQVEMDVETFSGENALIIRPRQPHSVSRTSGTCYADPFRIMAIEVYTQRHLRHPGQKSLRLSIEVSWEPRLQPLRLSLPMSEITVINDRGGQIPVLNVDGELDAPVQLGYQSIELHIPLQLPDRSIQQIASLRGTFRVLVPGRMEEFRFDKLLEQKPIEMRRGGVVVTLDRARKNNAIWEIHMRLRFDQASDAFASHLGWMLQNETYLEEKDGTPINHLGYETTSQTDQEICLAYLFELPEGEDLKGMTWVYKTPAAIVQMPVTFELKQIELP